MRGSDPVIVSRVYETTPVDCADDAEPFLNAALEITTDLSPHELLRHLLEIETVLGRPNNHPRNSPRTIDLDLLYCDGLTQADANLTLPHPRIAERAFVLFPLADVRPRMILPGKRAQLRNCSPAPIEVGAIFIQNQFIRRGLTAIFT